MPPLISANVGYYGQREALETEFARWSQLPQDIRDGIEFVIIDDGSPEPLQLMPRPELQARLFRVQEDVPYNFPGVSNLGATVAAAPWLLHFDLDHGLTVPLLRRCLQIVQDQAPGWHRFPVAAEPFSASSFLVRVADYWQTGGADEDFAGRYGWDDANLHWRIERTGQPQTIHREPFEFLAHNAAHLDRDWHENHALARRKCQSWTGAEPLRVLRFPWRQVW